MRFTRIIGVFSKMISREHQALFTKHIWCTLLIAALCLFSSTAMAQDFDDEDMLEEDEFDDEDDAATIPSGFLLYAGIEAPMQIDTDISENIAIYGGGVQFKLGYRWEQAAMFLEQSIAYTDSRRNGDNNKIRVLASTYWVLAGYAPLGKNWMFNVGVGLGAIYGDHDSVARSGNYGCASVKFETGLEYRFTDNLSLGVNFAYALGIVEKSKRVDKAKDGLLHYIYPTIGITYAF